MDQPSAIVESLERPSKRTREKPKSKLNLFKELGNYNPVTETTRVVSTDEFAGLYEPLFFRNGGDWCRSTACKNCKIGTMTGGGKINLRWDADADELDKVIQEFSTIANVPETKTSSLNKIKYIKIFGTKQKTPNRSIRSDIKRFYSTRHAVYAGQ